MRYEVSKSDTVRARSPHELFLVNLVFNHIFLLIAALMATSLRGTVLIVPIVSAAILGYTLWRAKRSQIRDPWFVVCHWQIAAKRSLFFAAMWVIAGAIILGLLAISGGDLKPGHYAVGGVFGVPVMGTMLVLILMESEAMQHASNGTLPKWALERYPHQETNLESADPAPRPTSQ
ncbi:hypothetical protein [Thiohalomonas denitrificans]|uniref:hypothetical protein n=1 Tax=Thiohalomonas denitrificans TaxID=415747 RepID=UPI0026EC5AAE|nr:hypothetical protein [Thiohalomonas denitrificans]